MSPPYNELCINNNCNRQQKWVRYWSCLHRCCGITVCWWGRFGSKVTIDSACPLPHWTLSCPRDMSPTNIPKDNISSILNAHGTFKFWIRLKYMYFLDLQELFIECPFLTFVDFYNGQCTRWRHMLETFSSWLNFPDWHGGWVNIGQNEAIRRENKNSCISHEQTRHKIVTKGAIDVASLYTEQGGDRWSKAGARPHVWLWWNSLGKNSGY